MSARIVLAVLSATVLVATGMSWATVGSLKGGSNSTDVLDPVPQEKHHQEGDGATDILLVGHDSRTDVQGNPLPLDVLKALRTEQSQGTNTDTIIVVRIPDDGSAAHAVSIPRDTYVEIPGTGRSDKINSVYGVQQSTVAQQLRDSGFADEARIERESAQGGRRALVNTVEELTGARIDHFAEINLYGFYLLTQAIGGVEVCLNKPTTDPGSGADFPAGRQTLSGGDALSFVRQRGGLPRGDLDRIVRQQVFMASAVNEVLSAGTLTDPARLSAMVSATRRSVVLDKDWDVLAFAQQMHGIAAGAVDFVTIPVLDIAARNDKGQSIVTVDPVQVRAFVSGLLGAPGKASPAAPAAPGPVTPGAPVADAPLTPGGLTAPGGLNPHQHTVDVLNGTDVTGLAGEVSSRLVTAGFLRGKTDNARPRRTTMIKVSPGRIDIGQQVADMLGGGIPVLTEEGLAADRVVVLIGTDYAPRRGDRLSGPGLLRLDGGRAAAPPPRLPAPQPSPISADGVPCIN